MTEDKKTFVMTEDHLNLLSNLRLGWNSAGEGVPAVNEKSPYGDVHLYNNMLEILGWEVGMTLNGNKYEGLFNAKKDQVPEILRQKLFKLHRDIESALEICLRTKSFEVGTYEADIYNSNWVKI